MRLIRATPSIAFPPPTAPTAARSRPCWTRPWPRAQHEHASRASPHRGDAAVLMHQLIRDGAERTPDKIALRWVDRDRALSFAAAVAAMERFAGALHHL